MSDYDHDPSATIRSLEERIHELEAENSQLENRPVPIYDSYNRVCFHREDLLAMLAEIEATKERERELDAQEKRRKPIEPAYRGVITLGSDADIQINGDDISMIMAGPNGMKHVLVIDRGSLEFIMRHIDSPFIKKIVLDNTGRQDLVASRSSQWRYEMQVSEKVLVNMNPKM